jgi:hypothetical protein
LNWWELLSVTIPGDWFVNPKVLSDFYRKYKNLEIQEIREVSYKQGLALGQSLKNQLGIHGEDIDAIATLLRNVLKDEPTAKITTEEGRILLRNSGFCPLMTACLSMNLPWTWLCSALGWPFFHGLASSVNPKVDLIMTTRREKGAPYCDHVFRIGEGRLIIP